MWIWALGKIGWRRINLIGSLIPQFAVNKKFRENKVASTLFNYIGEKYDRNLTIINIDESSKATNQFLQKIGFEKLIEQLEMKLELR